MSLINFYTPRFQQTKKNFSAGNNTDNNSSKMPSYNSLVTSKAYDNKFSSQIQNAAKEKSKGNLDKAISLYSGIYTKNNKELRAISGLADCYTKKGEYQQALKYIGEAKKIAPNLDNVSRIEKNIFFSQIGSVFPVFAQEKKKETNNSSLQKARTMVENFSAPLKAALKDVPVNFGKTDPDAIGECDGYAITINEKILGNAAPQVLAAVIAHEAVHAGDRDSKETENKDSIAEETDAFEEAAKVWDANKNGIIDLDADETSKIYNEGGRKGLEKFVKKLYKGNHAADYQYSPGHYEEEKPHIKGAVTCKTRNGFIALN